MTTSFTRHVRSRPTFRLSEVAALLGVTLSGEGDPELVGIAPLRDATPFDLSLLASRAYLGEVPDSRAGALIVSESLAGELAADERRPRVGVRDPHTALARILDWLHSEQGPAPGVHPTAVVADDVELAEGVSVGPFTVLEEGVIVGPHARIGAHCVVGAGSVIGAHTHLHPQVVLYPGSTLGERVILHAGARIGSDGFGYVFVDGRHRKVLQVGGCVLGDEVEVGANSTLDRGSIGSTRVEAGAKIDNLVQLGHNVVIGAGSILVSQTGVSGSTRFGRGVVAGGQSGFAGHITVGDGARIAGQAGVTASVEPGETVMGFPARPRREFLRATAAAGKAPELLRRIRELEARLDRIEGTGGPESPGDVRLGPDARTRAEGAPPVEGEGDAR